MKKFQITALLIASLTLGGCATVQYGSESIQKELQDLNPVKGKTSFYVCRESAIFSGAGNRTTVFVNQKPIGTLKPGNFAHTIVEPGEQEVFIKRNPGGNSGVLKLSTLADEVAIVWVGVTGAGFGVLTVDNFKNRSDAENCIKNSEYAIFSKE